MDAEVKGRGLGLQLLEREGVAQAGSFGMGGRLVARDGARSIGRDRREANVSPDRPGSRVRRRTAWERETRRRHQPQSRRNSVRSWIKDIQPEEIPHYVQRVMQLRRSLQRVEGLSDGALTHDELTAIALVLEHARATRCDSARTAEQLGMAMDEARGAVLPFQVLEMLEDARERCLGEVVGPAAWDELIESVMTCNDADVLNDELDVLIGDLSPAQTPADNLESEIEDASAWIEAWLQRPGSAGSN